MMPSAVFAEQIEQRMASPNKMQQIQPVSSFAGYLLDGRRRGATGQETQGFKGKTQGFEGKTQGLSDKDRGSDAEKAGVPPPERQGLPSELVRKIAAPGKRPEVEDLRRVVRELCSHRPMTPLELASTLGERDVANFVRSHITPMIEAGELERIYPENPAHPRQAYRTTSAGREKA